MYTEKCKFLSWFCRSLVLWLPSVHRWQQYPPEIRDVTTPEDFSMPAWEKFFCNLSSAISYWALRHEYYLH